MPITGLEKGWTKEIELQIAEKWRKEEPYHLKGKIGKKFYSIDTPPPYLNKPIHIGQATTYVLMDMFARYHRMKGDQVLFPLGLDNNGIPIEIEAEKKFNVKFNQVEREKFVEMCKAVLKESGSESIDSLAKLGCGFNSYHISTDLGGIYETDSPSYRALTQQTFIELWNKKLIYEAERINNFCPGCLTTIADSEIEYEDLNTFFNEIKFKVKETGEEIIIATTRPELIASCGMVIFAPGDERYAKLQGKTAITPIYNKEVKIISHPFAKSEKGTGLVMMCAGGDVTDTRFFIEMSLKPVMSIGMDARMNENAGFLKGMKVKEARKAIIEDLKNKNLLVKQTQILHRTPTCERSKDPIEFIAMKEYYVKQLDFQQKLLKESKKMKFYDEESRKLLEEWIQGLKIDWPITRRRIYGTEVPLWYCKKCNEPVLAEIGKYVQPWKDPAPVKKCKKCSSTEFVGETRVLDTWFDSSNSQMYILGRHLSENQYNSLAPATVRTQGKEIVRTWLYYSLLKNYLVNGSAPFKEVWVNYHIIDDKGKKMSKSKGNVINPKEVLEKFGAEPFRLWAVIEGELTKTDFRCSFERIEGAGKTITKLFNVAKFITQFPFNPKAKFKMNALDDMIMNEMNSLIQLTDEKYAEYDFHTPATEIKRFIWETFASHYLEMAKIRAYNSEKKYSSEDQNAAIHTLNYCLENILKLLAPITPFFTEKMYGDLYGKNIHFLEFPTPGKKVKTALEMKELMDLNGLIWKAKKDANVSLKSPIKELVLDSKFKGIERDLKATHSVEKLSYGQQTKIVI